MRIFVVLPNQHDKETTLVEAKNEATALELARRLYGASISIRETEYYFGDDDVA